jgi:hypothetical protein
MKNQALTDIRNQLNGIIAEDKIGMDPAKAKLRKDYPEMQADDKRTVKHLLDHDKPSILVYDKMIEAHAKILPSIAQIQEFWDDLKEEADDLFTNREYQPKMLDQSKNIFAESKNQRLADEKNATCSRVFEIASLYEKAIKSAEAYQQHQKETSLRLGNFVTPMDKTCQTLTNDLSQTSQLFTDFKAKWREYDDYEYSALRIRQFEALQNSKIPDFFKRYDLLTQKLQTKWFLDKIAPKSQNQRFSLLPYLTKNSSTPSPNPNPASLSKRFLNSIQSEKLGDPSRAGFISIHLSKNTKFSNKSKAKASNVEIFELFMVENIFFLFEDKALWPAFYSKMKEKD